MILKIQYIRRN